MAPTLIKHNHPDKSMFQITPFLLVRGETGQKPILGEHPLTFQVKGLQPGAVPGFPPAALFLEYRPVSSAFIFSSSSRRTR